MGSVTGIPTTRLSDLFVRQRLMNQVQMDQLDVFRLQTQVSTGHRLQVPSDDPDGALRIMGLQRLLERKAQIRTNLVTSQSYLTATDTALSTVSGNLAEVRATALGVMGTIATDTQRAAAAQQVQQTIRQLLDTANQNFRGRYLFAGAGTMVQPFTMTGADLIRYAGDEKRLASYADIDLLFETNVPGSEVFGGLSQEVVGTDGLQAVLTYDTRLADLRGGRGTTPGSIAISMGGNSTTIDLGGAETIGDVVAMIAAQPPLGKTITVELSATGLVISAEGDPGDVLTIREVGGGTTADDLGILTPVGTGTTVTGKNLRAVLNKTTLLDNILLTPSAAPAKAVVRHVGANNDLVFRSRVVGDALNGTTIVFQEAAAEVVSYTDVAGNKTLTFSIIHGQTTAADVVRMLDDDPTAGQLFSACLDPTEAGGNDGSGAVVQTDPASPPTLAGGSGTPLDTLNGLRIVNGGAEHVFDLADLADPGRHATIEDLLNRLNMSGAGVLAEINASGSGINVRSRLSGTDFMIGENASGTTADQLGLRTFARQTRLEDLNYARGVEGRDGADFTVTLSNGTSFDVDLTTERTVGDVLDLIQGRADAAAPGVLQVRLARSGNGIELIEATPAPGGTLTVTQANMSGAAIDLGLIPTGSQSNSAVVDQGQQILTGRDVNPLETAGVFTALLRLQTALQANDVPGMQRAVAMLDEEVVRLNFSRAELGARQQGLDVMQQRLDDEEIDLQAALSVDYDVDLVEVVSELTGRQLAYEAALRTTANIFQMTLLNYL